MESVPPMVASAPFVFWGAAWRSQRARGRGATPPAASWGSEYSSLKQHQTAVGAFSERLTVREEDRLPGAVRCE